MAGLRYGFQLLFTVQRAIFGRVGDIDHAGENHVLVVAVLPEPADKFPEFCRLYLSFMLGQFQHFMAGKFNGSGFVGAYMPRMGCNDPFVGGQHGVDDDLVGLGSAY